MQNISNEMTLDANKKYIYLEAIVTSKFLQNCCVLALTETWLTENHLDSLITLNGYWSIRHDRDNRATDKTKGGGLIVYINNSWCDIGNQISIHTDPTLEMMAIRLRPFWLPSLTI